MEVSPRPSCTAPHQRRRRRLCTEVVQFFRRLPFAADQGRKRRALCVVPPVLNAVPLLAHRKAAAFARARTHARTEDLCRSVPCVGLEAVALRTPVNARLGGGVSQGLLAPQPPPHFPSSLLSATQRTCQRSRVRKKGNDAAKSEMASAQRPLLRSLTDDVRYSRGPTTLCPWLLYMQRTVPCCLHNLSVALLVRAVATCVSLCSWCM